MIRKRPRRAMSQMNVVPYIDVMLVLLVIFMATAPFLSPSQVELPRVGQGSGTPVGPLEVVLRSDAALILRDRAADGREEPFAEAALVAELRVRQRARPGQPVVIAGDRNLRYEQVMRLMDLLQRGGVERIGLLVQPAAS